MNMFFMFFRQMVALCSAAIFMTIASAADSTKDLLETAPVFQLLLDNSGSSPATDQSFVNSAWPIIESKVRSLPMGTVVIVNTVGDASLSPLMKRTRIQKVTTGEGAAVEDIVRSLKSIVLGFPKRVQGQEHGQSHLIGGFFDASKNLNINASTKNLIVALTDLIEFSSMANCYKDKACRLPKPAFKLDNTDLVALGVGRGLPSDREIAVFSSWGKFFSQTGASFDLRKTF